MAGEVRHELLLDAGEGDSGDCESGVAAGIGG